MKKIMVAMSGGVDSSVSALLLKQKGYTVAGLTMRLATSDSNGTIEYFGNDAVTSAANVCDQIGIEHYVVDLSQPFIQNVVEEFIEEYFDARTPNPCVQCNRSIKFGELYQFAQSKGYEYFATGHYADIVKTKGSFYLHTSKDIKKDQSYFLYVIPQNILKNIIFPLSDLTKSEVREIALQAGLSVAKKVDSQDICFLKGNDYRDFIRKFVDSKESRCIKEGNFVNSKGQILGRHIGIPMYTIGQRRGMGVAAEYPLYVISFNKDKNEIILGSRDELQSNELYANQINMFHKTIPENLTAKIRYSQVSVPCRAEILDDILHVVFTNSIDAITYGQSVVLYHENIVVGGGVIFKKF